MVWRATFRRSVRIGVLVLLAGCGSTGRATPQWAGRVTCGAALASGDRLRRAGLLDEAELRYLAAARQGSAARQGITAKQGSAAEQGVAGDVRRAALGLHALDRERGLVLASRRAMEETGDRFLQAVTGGGPARVRNAYLEGFEEPWRSLGLGVVAWDEGRFEECAGHFGRAVEVDPGFVPALVGLAQAHLVAGRLARAEECFERARWAAPEEPATWAGLGAIADRRGDLPGAVGGALGAWERAPGSPDLCERLHEVVARTGSAALFAEVGGRLVGRTGEGDGLGPAGRAEALLRGGDLLARAGKRDEADAARRAAVESGIEEQEIAALAGGEAPAALGDFLAELQRGVQGRYRHYISTSEQESFAEFVAWVRVLYERTTGETLEGAAAIRSWTLIGSLVDPTEGSTDPLVRACARHGVLLVLGQRGGAPPEALVGRILRRESSREVVVRGTTIEREVVWIDHVHLPGYQEWAGGGDLAGLALDRLLIIDVGAIARWAGRARRERFEPERHRERVLAQEATPTDDPRSIEDPADVHRRLLLAGQHDLAGEVLRHEESHIVDAEQHLPVLDHPWRNLSLAVSRGFDAASIVAFLERNAQVAAIAEGPSPRGALATCCERLGSGDPHARGYAEIVEGIVDRIVDEPERFPAIDTSRVVVQQLHRLSDAEIVILARELMHSWGLYP